MLSFKKVVALGLIRDADRTFREVEQYLAAALSNRGQRADCACELYGPKMATSTVRSSPMELSLVPSVKITLNVRANTPSIKSVKKLNHNRHLNNSYSPLKSNTTSNGAVMIR